MSNSYIFLHKGYFWSAGTQYGWSSTDPGVGIAMKKIKDALPNDRVYVKSRYDDFNISPKVAMKYGKPMTLKNGTKLLIIPKSKFVKSKFDKS